jgi:[acyl-carrier-protein] S-malonyltransferase
MGRALAAVSPASAAVFNQADDALGEPLSRLAWEGPAEELDLTVNAQPALLAASIAFLRALQERRAAAGRAPLLPTFAAGHSMGQYSALVAAGVISLADGIRLVRERGRLMQASGEGHPGAMAAIIGLPDERLDDLVAAGAAHGTFGVANRNSPARSSSPACDCRRGRGGSERARRKARRRPSCEVAAHSSYRRGSGYGRPRRGAFADPLSPGQRRCSR